MKRQANPDGKDLIKDYGWVYYLNKYEFPWGFLKLFPGDPIPQDDRQLYSREIVESSGGQVDPDPVLAYNDGQNKVLKNNGTDIRDYFNQNIDKFIMGTRPIGEWDQFVKEVKALGVDNVAMALNEAYEVYKKK
jgi:putative aldouronate transport system substrate-binding protein